MLFDLAIIGGGPAGAACAIRAAASGARVALLERGKFPRHKVCGEFVSAESLDLLAGLLDSAELPLLTNSLRIPQGRIFLDGRTVHTPLTPPAASIARFDLDAALWRSAEKRGVHLMPQVTVQNVSGDGPFLLSTSAGDLQARAVVDASGRWSNLRPPVANNGSGKWLGVKSHFSEENPSLSVDLYFFDGGYCGVQPVSSIRVNACAMVRADVASTLQEVFKLHPLLEGRSAGWQAVSDPVATSPLLFRDPEPVRGHLLQAGDAAAFVDPFVGDGISLALRSGALAADSLVPFIRGEMALETAAANYGQAYQERLASVFRASSKIRRMLSLPRSVRVPALVVMEKVPAVAKFLVSRTR